MFCRQCGNEIPDGSRFCQNCGNSVSNEENQSSSLITPKGLHCPQCSSKRLQAIVESNTSGQGGGYSGGKGCLGFLLLGPLGLLCGSCGGNKNVITTNKTFWICQNCGHKFRDKQEMLAEKKQISIALLSGGVMSCIFSIAFFIISNAARAGRNYDDATGALVSGLIFVVLGVILIIYGIKLKQDYNKQSIKQEISMKDNEDK